MGQSLVLDEGVSSFPLLLVLSCLPIPIQEMPMQETPPIVQPGQKFRRKESNTVYIVKSIKDNEILLVSEDGTASIIIQLDSLALSGLEPIQI